jgi:hypothetical protein
MRVQVYLGSTKAKRPPPKAREPSTAAVFVVLRETAVAVLWPSR